jgi:hypothetical protein
MRGKITFCGESTSSATPFFGPILTPTHEKFLATPLKSVPAYSHNNCLWTVDTVAIPFAIKNVCYTFIFFQENDSDHNVSNGEDALGEISEVTTSEESQNHSHAVHKYEYV